MIDQSEVVDERMFNSISQPGSVANDSGVDYIDVKGADPTQTKEILNKMSSYIREEVRRMGEKKIR